MTWIDRATLSTPSMNSTLLYPGFHISIRIGVPIQAQTSAYWSILDETGWNRQKFTLLAPPPLSTPCFLFLHFAAASVRSRSLRTSSSSLGFSCFFRCSCCEQQSEESVLESVQTCCTVWYRPVYVAYTHR